MCYNFVLTEIKYVLPISLEQNFGPVIILVLSDVVEAVKSKLTILKS